MSTNQQMTTGTMDSVMDVLCGGSPITLSLPTGDGRSIVAAEIVGRWRSTTGARKRCVVIAPNETTAIQWKRHDIVAISRLRASQQARKTGAVLGHATRDVELVVIEDADFDRGDEVSNIRRMFENATFLLLNGVRSEGTAVVSVDRHGGTMRYVLPKTVA